MVHFLVTLLIVAVSLIIISKLPIGVEIDSIQKALVAALVFGILNAFLKPILTFLAAPITFLTLGLFTVIINAIIFGLAAKLVTGFRLRWGVWSALLGAFLLGVVQSFIIHLLPFTV